MCVYVHEIWCKQSLHVNRSCLHDTITRLWIGTRSCCLCFCRSTYMYVAIKLIIIILLLLYGGQCLCKVTEIPSELILNFVTASSPVQGHWQCANSDDDVLMFDFFCRWADFPKKLGQLAWARRRLLLSKMPSADNSSDHCLLTLRKFGTWCFCPHRSCSCITSWTCP